MDSRLSKNAGLRILMIAPQPWFQPRGTPFSVLHRIKALSLLGHTIDLVTYPIGQNIAIDGLAIHRTRKPLFLRQVKIGPSAVKILLDILLYRKTIDLLQKNQYDYLHTHEEASFFGVPLAKRFGLPHLYDMHSSLPQQLQNFKFSNSRLLRGLFERLERNTIENSAAVITICPELQDYIQKHFPRKTSLLIENVADNSVVFPSTADKEEILRQQFQIPNKTIILYYGTFETYQGLDMLIDSAREVAARQRNDIHFLLVGGSEQQVAAYRSRISKLGLAEFFTLTGFVQPELIPSFISLCQVLISPRLQGTNSPLKIYSYLRSGKPIIATRHITHTQILNDSVSVLAEPHPEPFAEAILALCDDPKKQSRLVTAARQLAEKHYSYD
ncbi:MAG: glycosyltransferase, partial [Calditrichaeota bacterium]